MDQSKGAAPAAVAEPAAPEGPPAAFNAPPPPVQRSATPLAAPPAGPSSDITFQPRTNGRQVTGVTVFPQGNGNAFRAAGLAPGDVILSANGRRISSVDQARDLGGQIGAGPLVLQVERNGRVMTLRPGSGR
jgi:general secretion pathway protein C